jgi:ATP synthase protein I
MTTAPQSTSPGPRAGAVGPVVRRALVVTMLVGTTAAVLGALATGTPALLGAAIGTAMVCLFFGGGAVVLDAVAALAPAASLLVALLTYTLQVVLVGAVFVGLRRSGLLEQAIDPRWLGGTVIAATLTWLTVQVVASMRTRIPVYEFGVSNRLPEPAAGRSGGQEADER